MLGIGDGGVPPVAAGGEGPGALRAVPDPSGSAQSPCRVSSAPAPSWGLPTGETQPGLCPSPCALAGPCLCSRPRNGPGSAGGAFQRKCGKSLENPSREWSRAV